MTVKKAIIDNIVRGGGKLKVTSSVSALFCCSAFFAAFAEAQDAIGWAEDTIAVDATAPFRMAAGELVFKYNTDWCTVTNVADATAELLAVTGPDTANAVTTAVTFAENADPASGIVQYEGEGYMRFILNAKLNGEVIGDSLVSDVSFGSPSAFSAAAAFDGRTNALQEVINAKATTSLRYDLLWGNVASNAEISLVCVRRKKNGDILDVNTNGLYDVDTFHADDVDFSTARLQWGDYRLLLQEYAADGTLLMEMFSPEFSIPHIYGTCFIIR